MLRARVVVQRACAVLVTLLLHKFDLGQKSWIVILILELLIYAAVLWLASKAIAFLLGVILQQLSGYERLQARGIAVAVTGAGANAASDAGGGITTSGDSSALIA